MEAERARQADEEAQRQATILQEALESMRSGDNPHLALHQLQLLHRLPLESVLSLQAQLCSCLHAVEQVGPQHGHDTTNPRWCVLTKCRTCKRSKRFGVFAQVVYRKQRQCCVTCGEQGSVSLPCGHGLQCESCSSSTECPLCPDQTLQQQLS